MAKTIATATGNDKTRTKETHRLGSVSSSGEAATWRTFANVTIFADGHGFVEVIRDYKVIHRHEWGPETP